MRSDPSLHPNSQKNQLYLVVGCWSTYHTLSRYIPSMRTGYITFYKTDVISSLHISPSNASRMLWWKRSNRWTLIHFESMFLFADVSLVYLFLLYSFHCHLVSSDSPSDELSVAADASFFISFFPSCILWEAPFVFYMKKVILQLCFYSNNPLLMNPRAEWNSWC